MKIKAYVQIKKSATNEEYYYRLTWPDNKETKGYLLVSPMFTAKDDLIADLNEKCKALDLAWMTTPGRGKSLKGK